MDRSDIDKEVDRISNMTDEEIIQECVKKGLDPKEEAQKIREKIMLVLEIFKK